MGHLGVEGGGGRIRHYRICIMRSEHTRRLFAGKAGTPAVAQVQSGLMICVQTKNSDALTIYIYNTECNHLAWKPSSQSCDIFTPRTSSHNMLGELRTRM